MQHEPTTGATPGAIPEDTPDAEQSHEERDDPRAQRVREVLDANGIGQPSHDGDALVTAILRAVDGDNTDGE